MKGGDKMLISGADIYWITRLDAVIGLWVALGIIAAVMAFIACFEALWYFDDKESGKGWKGIKYGVLCTVLSLICWGGVAFTPSTKQMCAILAIPHVLNNERVQDLPNQVLDLAHEWIKELKPTTDGATEETTNN